MGNSVRPSKVLKIDEVDQSSFLNNETYIHYYNRLLLMITSLFKWEKLPNDIPERFIEKTLFNFGQIAFIDDESFGFMMTKCTQYDQLNHYDEPIAWNCYGNNGYQHNYQNDEIEVIRNNKLSYPTSVLLQHHLKRLYDIERTIDNNLYHQRNMVILKSSENQRLTMQNIMKEYDGFGYMIFGNDRLDTKSLEVLDIKIPFIGLDLEDLKERKWNDLINMLGINSANTQKKERLITDEANANNQMINLNVDVMLAERKLAVDRINERFNLDIKVSLRQEIECEDFKEDATCE